MITAEDIANELNISTSTVYKSLRGARDISQLTKQTVLTVAQKYDFTDKSRHSSACRQRTGVFLFRTNQKCTNEHFIRNVMSGFHQAADSRLWQTFEIPVRTNPSIKFNYEKSLNFHRCSAGFLLSMGLDEDLHAQIESTKKPTVLLNDMVYNRNTACVGISRRQEIYAAVRHLAKLGHKRITMFCESAFGVIREKEIYDFKQVMRKCGLIPQSNLVFLNQKSISDEIVGKLIQSGFTAVICTNAWIAHDLLAELYLRKVRVPDRISVIGLGDISFASYMTPPLTTVQKNGYEVGRSACMAIEQIILQNHVNCILTAPELVIRESTGNPPK